MLDNASDLAALDAVRFGALIEKYSGRLGVDAIEDFADWYRQEHPGESEFPRTGHAWCWSGWVSTIRARRVVNFLAESQVDIQLMTFHAFREDGKLFLARQIESNAVVPPKGRTLHDTAKSLGVDELLTQARQFHRGTHRRITAGPTSRLTPTRWRRRRIPATPSWRAYAALYVLTKKPGSLMLAFTPRAAKGAADAVEEFCRQAPVPSETLQAATRSNSTSARTIGLPLEQPLDKFLTAVVEGWKRWARDDPKSDEAADGHRRGHE